MGTGHPLFINPTSLPSTPEFLLHGHRPPKSPSLDSIFITPPPALKRRRTRYVIHPNDSSSPPPPSLSTLIITTCSDVDIAFPKKTDRKMLVIDLQQALRNNDPSTPTSFIRDSHMSKEAAEFEERVGLDKKTSKKPIYIVFTSASSYAASMKSITDANLIEPDALVTLNGTELYQKGYKTPDPFWAKEIGSGWTPKPVEWTLKKFFNDEIDHVTIHGNEDDKGGLSIPTVTCKCKGIGPSVDFCSRVMTKLKDMGIGSRVVLLDNDNEDDVIIMPAAGSTVQVVGFCQMMLGIQEKLTFVFGSDDLVNDCIQGKSNIGLCTAATEQQWDAFDGRVFVSKEYGMKALMDGLYHHAVF